MNEIQKNEEHYNEIRRKKEAENEEKLNQTNRRLESEFRGADSNVIEKFKENKQ